MEKLARRIRVENLCSIWILVYGYLKLTEFCVILLCFNGLFTLIHKMKYSWFQRILLLFEAGLFIGLCRLTKSNRESSFSKLSLLHLAGCVSSPGSLSNFITMWRHNMVAISKAGNFRTLLSLSEILSDPVRCKLVRYQWFCSNHCFCWLQRDTTKSYWNSKDKQYTSKWVQMV